jgi:TetR/AcrR family tetracycline transcriptional repressor
VRHQALGLHRVLLAHPGAIPLFATRPAATPAAIDRLSTYLEFLAAAGFKPFDALSIIQLVAQLVVGHAMWTTAIDVVAAPIDPPPQVARALEKWNPDRELTLGIDAMLRGFEALR